MTYSGPSFWLENCSWKFRFWFENNFRKYSLSIKANWIAYNSTRRGETALNGRFEVLPKYYPSPPPPLPLALFHHRSEWPQSPTFPYTPRRLHVAPPLHPTLPALLCAPTQRQSHLLKAPSYRLSVPSRFDPSVSISAVSSAPSVVRSVCCAPGENVRSSPSPPGIITILKPKGSGDFSLDPGHYEATGIQPLGKHFSSSGKLGMKTCSQN